MVWFSQIWDLHALDTKKHINIVGNPWDLGRRYWWCEHLICLKGTFMRKFSFWKHSLGRSTFFWRVSFKFSPLNKTPKIYLNAYLDSWNQNWGKQKSWTGDHTHSRVFWVTMWDNFSPSSTWRRIIPISKWLVTTIYKPFRPFRPFGRGTTLTLLRGLTNHGYQPLTSFGMILQVFTSTSHTLEVADPVEVCRCSPRHGGTRWCQWCLSCFRSAFDIFSPR